MSDSIKDTFKLTDTNLELKESVGSDEKEFIELVELRTKIAKWVPIHRVSLFICSI